MASTSTSSCNTGRQPENEHTNAFEEIVPSPSTFGRSTMPERKVPYDVFINHRGPDVKHTLAATLYNTLSGMGLRVFLDKEELELGDFLPTEIEEAMCSASLHIAIFSQTYAQSPWCLAELSFMLKTGTQIVPVFYHVQPGDIRHEKGLYADKFSQHKEKGRYTSDELQEWKNALNNVSYNVGGISHNEDDEGTLLKNIVNCVLKVVKNVPFVVANHPIGVDEAVIDFERTTIQSAESHGTVQIVGIWGMGGSGKITLAKQLYNNKYKTVEKSSFLVDVRDAASKSVLHNKLKKLLEDLGLSGVSIDNIEEGKGILARRLRSVQVLIILDDVDNVDQLDALVPKKDSLGWDSLIVVTTRELEVLRCWGISSIYKMKALDPTHAKQLFCWHAFLQPSPHQAFEDLVENFVSVCNGLPLSLKVFGAQLYGISNKDCWETQLHKISRILPTDIKERLKVSYDALDDEEKQIFLDTACFFIGETKSSAIAAWDGSGWSGLHSWERLLNKCLIELNYDDCIRMHDHLKDLGREIANNQSPSRLWSSQQIELIINVHNGVQGITIRGIMAKTDESTSQVEQFARCSQGGKLNTCRGSCSLALLSLLGGKLNTQRGSCSLAHSLLGLKIFEVTGNFNYQVIGDLSRELVWLRWFDVGQRNLQSLGSLQNLRVLELHGRWDRNRKHQSELDKLWKTERNAPLQLRELVISQCPDFQGFPKSIGLLRYLKKIVVSLCSKMRSLPEEFCLLQSLEHLHLQDQELLSLPSSFGDLRNLRHLDLSCCWKLTRLPVSFKELTLLQHLNLQGCFELSLELDILENMTRLKYLYIQGCRQLEEMPPQITNQASLTELHFRISRLREVPVKISQLSKLQKMHIGSQLLTSLPTSIGDLSSLTSLEISGCPKLEYLPDSLGRLNLIEDLVIENSGVKSLPKSASGLINLQMLQVLECPISELSVSQLINLQKLFTGGCPISELDLEAGLFTSLKLIDLESTKVSKISISEDCCPSLETLELRSNDHLTEIQVVPNTLKRIALNGCPKLDALPSFAESAFLRDFELEGCYGVEKTQGLEHCRALETLRAHTRWEEAGIESLEQMERLTSVQLRAISRSAVESCIQSMQIWPKEEIIVCTRAAPNSASLVDSFDFPNLSVVDSFANQKIKSNPSLKWPSNARCILLCFVVNCESPRTLLDLNYITKKNTEATDIFVDSGMELEEGKWVWTALFTEHSVFHRIISHQTQSLVRIRREGQEGEGEVEKGLLVMGEEERVVEAFIRLWGLLSN